MPRYWRSRARRNIDNARSSVIASNLDYFERYRSKISYASAKARRLGPCFDLIVSFQTASLAAA